ncbi:unnamed protein product [Paramecium pentaurelia]|uniref:Uncharacterized protein n=1 Tax=Paramecium pentaurelia TaxID=43138 RepID=A0A8S1WLY7_9CILI|nr:unnamed protein product [Paramecium pentaurelia]
MDELEKKYQDQINTLQKAIKTQNEVLINKIQTIINQSTLEVFQTLESNFAEFRQNYREIRDFKQQENEFVNYEYLCEEIQNYASLNLRTLREQISNSIGGLQDNKQVKNDDQQVSSLLDVMQLLLKAAELYMKNLKEAVSLPSPIALKDKFKQIQQVVGGFKDGRIGRTINNVESISFKENQILNCSQIFDIFPLLNKNQMLIATYENELFLYDANLNSIIQRIDSMRFVPCSCLQLFKQKDKNFIPSNLMLLGGSEFDPNIYLFDLYHGKKIQTFPGHEKSVRFLCQLGDINTFVSLGRDSKMFFWNLIKGEPHQILSIPTIEIIEMQFQVSTKCIYTLSIDGRICIIKISDDLLNFGKAEIVNLIELAQTSSLSQMIIEEKLKVISFSNGWLTGQNSIRIYDEIPLQTARKMKKMLEIGLESEISQLNTIITKEQLIVISIDKSNGKLRAFANGYNLNVISNSLQDVQEQTKQSRWNIKLFTINGQLNLIKSHNINDYYHDRLDSSFNNVNISFISTLRAPIQTNDLNKTVHDIPSCFGRKTLSMEKRHTTKDIEKLGNISIYEHLIRNRIGIKPHLGSIIFETSLRNNKKRSISQNQEHKPQKIITKERTILPKVLKDAFIEIQEKNINQFIHCLREEGQGTIGPAQVEWVTSLKSERKKKKKR